MNKDKKKIVAKARKLLDAMTPDWGRDAMGIGITATSYYREYFHVDFPLGQWRNGSPVVAALEAVIAGKPVIIEDEGEDVEGSAE